MCAVTSMAVFCSFLTFFFPSVLLRYRPSDFETVTITAFINMTVKQNNLLNLIIGCLYVSFYLCDRDFYVSKLWGYILSKTLLIEEYVGVAF